MFNISNFHDLRIFNSYTDGKPYYFIFKCNINETELMINNKKEEQWECHYASHATERCEYCGKVRLHSDCEEFTKLVQNNFEQVLKFVKEEKSKGEFG